MPVATLAPDLMELKDVFIPEGPTSLWSRIIAGGYGWTDKRVNQEQFSLTLGPGQRNLVLADFNTLMGTHEVESWARENRLQLALIDDALALGSHRKYKDLQREYQIVALGSRTDGYGFERFQRTPCLTSFYWNGRRALTLPWRSHCLWCSCTRFLLVRS